MSRSARGNPSGNPSGTPSGTPSGGHASAEPLLGAWLLNACSPEEAAAVEAHLRHCDRCAEEVRTLATALAGLADATPPAPPPELAARVTAGAFARRPPAPRGLPAYVRPYAAQLATLDAVLRELSDADWERETVEGWTVAQLVAHVAATDSLLADRVAGNEDGTIPGRTAEWTAWATGVPPATVHGTWRARAEALRDTLAEGGEELGARPARLAGRRPFPVADLTIGRAFETWVHTADIAGRTALPLPPPVDESLRPIADLGVRTLPLVMGRTGTPLDGRTLRVELTGRGGGEWLLGEGPGSEGPGSGGPAVAEIVVDTVEFCFLAGGRRDPDRMDAHLAGDRELAVAALRAAPTFSGP
ncbi:maleylpyruvate isomerase family mycothiol-dependent enzyme [Streptomyces sp. NPDC048172]|uniref:maleylpyruvate isomerase family mycothiol-dependent enzyme n=1 Tax=Streptomyces sp. NPDC048172 TaxID=3365505 RepID=UPI00372489B8